MILSTTIEESFHIRNEETNVKIGENNQIGDIDYRKEIRN